MQNLVNTALSANMEKTQRRTSADGLDENNQFVKAFRSVQQAVKASPDIINKGWNPDTTEAALTYFSNHTLRFLQRFDDLEFLSSDREALKQEIYDSISTNSRSKRINTQMQQTLQKHLEEADAIYEAMRREDRSLPAIAFSEGKKKLHIQSETVKSLPRPVRRRFARELEQRIQTEPEMVFGAVLMWDAGLRTGEAAAVIYMLDIHCIGEGLAVVEVEWQEKEGKRSRILKTKNAYRVV